MAVIEHRDMAREALQYILDHHIDGKECLCDAARSVAEAGLRLSEQQLAGAVDLARRLLHAIPHDHSEAMPGNPSGRCARCRFAAEFDALGGQ